ncbi:MAG: hypothetical protein ACRD07_01195 [Acidimicrobiales bacterium]
MGDEVLVRVGPGATGDARPPGAGGRWSGRGASSRRVVREASRGARVAAFISLAGLVAGGLLVLVRDGGGNVRRDDGADERPQADTADVAYTEAVRRFGRAGSFAYRGSVHAAGPSPMRPGPWLAPDVTVEGAVLLANAITREVAVDAGGRAVETVTSGPTAWSRTASSAGGLAQAPWEAVVTPDIARPRPPGAAGATRPHRLGIALVADVVRSAGNRHSEPPDATGRRTVHGSAPMNAADLRYGDLLAGAEVSLALDEAGDVDHISLTSAPVDDPQLVVELAIERLGEPDLITPAEIGDPARGAVPVDVLDAAGVEALELGRVPAGWALTDARATRDGTMGLPDECPWLSLAYRDLGAVADGWLSLGVTSEGCRARMGRRGIAWGEPFRAGSFSGRAEESWASTRGTVSDGVTTVSFNADLSADDTAVVLASLASFDVATRPVSIAGVPSS